MVRFVKYLNNGLTFMPVPCTGVTFSFLFFTWVCLFLSNMILTYGSETPIYSSDTFVGHILEVSLGRFYDVGVKALGSCHYNMITTLLIRISPRLLLSMYNDGMLDNNNKINSNASQRILLGQHIQKLSFA